MTEARGAVSTPKPSYSDMTKTRAPFNNIVTPRHQCCLNMADTESLPQSVTLLTAPNGAKVFLIGTVHFSKKSIEDVRQVIGTVKPHIVVLELCPERQHVLTLDQEALKKEMENVSFAQIRELARKQGLLSTLLRLLMVNISANITRQLGQAPGGEFREAFSAAKDVGSRVFLGDRRISITFGRLMASLTIWQKVTLFCRIAAAAVSGFKLNEEEVDSLRNKDMVDALMDEFKAEYPQVVAPLMVERDQYLSHTLKQAASSTSATSPQTGTTNCIVGVVGMGHVEGIKRHWEKDIDIVSLNTVPKSRRFSVLRLVGTVVVVCGFSVVCWRLLAKR